MRKVNELTSDEFTRYDNVLTAGFEQIIEGFKREFPDWDIDYDRANDYLEGFRSQVANLFNQS